MTKSQKYIIFINYFSLGILLPVLNLILLQRGANLKTLPLLYAVYAVTVFCFELPSGISADLYGRKSIFMISCTFICISFILLAFADNVVLLLPVMIFNGLGRAFSSGSIDALLIDQALEKYGQEVLPKVTFDLSLLEGSGLAIGGIIGGMIASLAGSYQVNIIIRILFVIVDIVLCAIFIKEKPQSKQKEYKRKKYIKSVSTKISLLAHIKEGKYLLLSIPYLGYLILGCFFAGFLINTVETYWQVQFLKITNTENNTWILGIISFLGFFAVTIGNFIAKLILGKTSINWFVVYHICRIMFGSCMILFGLQKSTNGFMLSYTGVYLIFGTNNVIENTLINKMTPCNIRASIMSLNSFLMQAGTFCASIIISLLIQHIHIKGLWILAGVLLSSYVVWAAIVFKKTKSKVIECR